MNGEQRAAALALAGKGVQVNDGYTYGVEAADLVAYADTIRALVAELDRVAPVCSCVEDVRCAPCMTGAVDPVTGVAPAVEVSSTGPWTDERIREAFIDDGGLAEYHDPINGAREQRRYAGAIFDSWLALRDRVTDAQVSAASASLTDSTECYYGHTAHGVRAALEAARAVRS